MAGVNDKVALITGGGRGIGLVAAEILAERGASVLCVSRSQAELEASGLPYVVADLGTEAGCEDCVSQAIERYGRIDILVCNHGLGSAHEKVVWEQDDDDWRRSMSINLDGPFWLSKAVLPGMIERRFGRLVFTSSTAGLVAEDAGSAYNASKAGLLGLMRSVATDAGAFGVTSNAVLPGWVRTEMAERSAAAEAIAQGITAEEVWKQRAMLYPAGRVVAPREVAEAIAFLASEESSGISGESIRVALGSMF